MLFRCWIALGLAVVAAGPACGRPMHAGQDALIPIHPDSRLVTDAIPIPPLTLAAAAEPDPAEALGLPSGSSIGMHTPEVVLALSPPGLLDDRFGLARPDLAPTETRGVGPRGLHPGTPCQFLRCLFQVGEVTAEEPVETFADASRAITIREAALAQGAPGPDRGQPNERLPLAFLPDLHEIALVGFVLLVLAGLAKRRG
jgi:hypothetical protein